MNISAIFLTFLVSQAITEISLCSHFSKKPPFCLFLFILVSISLQYKYTSFPPFVFILNKAYFRFFRSKALSSPFVTFIFLSFTISISILSSFSFSSISWLTSFFPSKIKNLGCFCFSSLLMNALKNCFPIKFLFKISFISVISSFTTSFSTFSHCLYFSDNVSISPERNSSTRFPASLFAVSTSFGSL